MKKILLLFCFLIFFSCSKRDTGQSESFQDFGDRDIVTDATGVEYPYLDPTVVSYCGPSWGRKFCRFLSKYDDTIWEDSGNYYSAFSDIKFSKFSNGKHFVSFFNLDSITSRCEGWKLGETILNGIKWNVKIKRDEVDLFWFEYDYYGTSQEIEYSITYKYEVIDGLLYFSSSDGKTCIFSPSGKNYLEDELETAEIVRLEGCTF